MRSTQYIQLSKVWGTPLMAPNRLSEIEIADISDQRSRCGVTVVMRCSSVALQSGEQGLTLAYVALAS